MDYQKAVQAFSINNPTGEYNLTFNQINIEIKIYKIARAGPDKNNRLQDFGNNNITSQGDNEMEEKENLITVQNKFQFLRHQPIGKYHPGVTRYSNWDNAVYNRFISIKINSSDPILTVPPSDTYYSL